MSSLLPKFVSRVDFQSYEDFKENLKILVPENFNFAYDVVDAYAAQNPEKRALVWCNDHGEEKIITFKDLKIMSDKAANLFSKYGLKKGDTVMLTLKSRWEFWVCMVGLNKIGAISIPSTHMLKAKDFIYRIKKADLKMIICIGENGVPGEFDTATRELGNVSLVKALVGDKELKREGWINFDLELEKASPDFLRPTGEEATTNHDILLGLLHLRHDRIPQDGQARSDLSPGPYPHRQVLAECGGRRAALHCGRYGLGQVRLGQDLRPVAGRLCGLRLRLRSLRCWKDDGRDG